MNSLYNLLQENIKNQNIVFFIFGLIISLFLISIPIVISILVPLFIKKPKKQLSIYIYAFVTGMFVILGSFGYLREAIEITSRGYNAASSQNQIYLGNILIVFGGATLGISIAFMIKMLIWWIIKRKSDIKNSVFIHVHEHGHHNGEEEHTHIHDDVIFNKNDIVDLQNNNKNIKNKWTALVLLLGHRVPEGLLIGLSLYRLIMGDPNSTISIAFFISFVLHTVPEEIVFFYRQREMKIKPFFAVLNSICAIALLIPFVFIGIYCGSFIMKNNFLQAFIMAIVGSIMLFTALIEFLPEFYHHKMGKRTWLTTILLLFVGILFTILILCFHVHGSVNMI
ncbi:ZIP family metal transporter [Mycoplasma elephantis]|uniref:ZIP family metal transporter n=1 Tax=Mycoplasma elephantis TaxID=114882 RepID=UPI00047FCC8D|nr:ZIP family metal transporter [Mycoplasma elephantis]